MPRFPKPWKDSYHKRVREGRANPSCRLAHLHIMDSGDQEQADAIIEEIVRTYNKIKPPTAGEIVALSYPCSCVPGFGGWDVRFWSKSSYGRYDEKAAAAATRKVLDKRWVRKLAS